MKITKKHFMEAFSYTCISFTTVSVLMAVAANAGLQRDLFGAETLQLLVVCIVLSTAQVICNQIPAIDNNQPVRALINMVLLFLLGWGVFGWFGGKWLSFLIGAVVSLIAYVAVWIHADYKIRRDAKEINEVLEQRRKNPQKEEE